LGISSLRAWILAASLLSVSAVAHAAGLGRINVLSALGEPLKAEVELVAEKKEIPSVAVRLASPEAFARAGLAYTSALSDVKVSVEKRGDGEPYVQLTSTQPISEPFLDLMLELTWSSGRVTRQFTALLDPPSLIAEREKQKAAEAQVKAAPPAPVEPKPEPVPEAAPEPTAEQATPTQPSDAPPTAETPAAPAPETATTPAPEPPQAAAAPAPSAPVETIGGTEPTLLGPGSSMPSAVAGADAYGPVKTGDTLGKIARANKPAEVSLDQMLVLLFRANPDAFSGKNMNRLKTGKIIQLPTSDQYSELSASDARKEVLAQARDWNAYREQVATAAGQVDAAAEPAQQSASGKVAPTVEDKAAQGAEAPKEVLKLSKNEPAAAGNAAAGGDAKSAARVRALEEELVARDKAVKDANDRVAKLEKTIQDLQHLLEIKNKGMSDLQKPAAPATGQPAPVQQPAAPPPAAATAPATPAAPEAKPATPAAPAPTTPVPGTEKAPPSTQPAPQPPKPAPPKPAAPPAPEPSLMDRVMEQPAYLGAGVIALILIGALAVRAVKRRRESKSDSDDSGPAILAAASAAGSTYGGATESVPQVAAAGESDEVDPVKEAEIFLAYGRDAQAEELLKEALATNPNRQEVRVLLLQIYAKRKDAKSFEQVARELQQATGSSGPFWDQAVALGYQVDPSNPRYAAGQGSGGLVAASAASADNVDFNIGSDDAQSGTATDIDLGDGGSGLESTQVIDLSTGPSMDDTAVMEAPPALDIAFNVDLPAAEPEREPEPPKASGGLDFDIDLNSFNAPASSQTAEPEPTASGGLDFDMSGLSLDAPAASEPSTETRSASAPEIDLSGISFDLGETTPRVSPSGKDDHWYDVQTKFDLAKAYQEMGDKDGAREILKEVVQEGDAEQKAAAQAVLTTLDA